MDFCNIPLIHALPSFCHFPIAFPAFWIRQCVLDLERFSLVYHSNAFDDVQGVAAWNSRINPVMVRNEVLCVHNQGVLFPMTDRLAIEDWVSDVGSRLRRPIPRYEGHEC